MNTLRTPDECFAAVPGFDYAPHYEEVDDGEGGSLRIHYVREGAPDAPVVLLLHGEPSWSYLYRTMIPVLTQAGLQIIAPDLVGFGRSDKPAERTDYTYARHVEWMRAFLFDRLHLRDITLVCQDWGGLIGLRLVGEHPDRFARVVAANTFLPTGDTSPGEAFFNWQRFSQEVEVFPTGFIVNSGCVTALAPEVQAAYDAPFPDESFKAGARAFPMLVPSTPDDPAHDANVAAWKGLAALRTPLPDSFRRRRPDHPWGASRAPRGHRWRQGPAAHDHRRWWPFPSGGPRRRTGTGGRRFRHCVRVNYVGAGAQQPNRGGESHGESAEHDGKDGQRNELGQDGDESGVMVDELDERIHGPGLGDDVADRAHRAADHVEWIDATTEHAGGDADNDRRGDGLLLAPGPACR